jgi:preprotein translocase subunit SecG
MNLIGLATVIYVLVAVAMVVLILMQRGAGAQAGSGFGAGASATVFGASGSANFLSSTTKWLAVVFFAMSLGMAWYASDPERRAGAAEQSAGLLSGMDASPADASEVQAAELASSALAESLGDAPVATEAPAGEVPAAAPEGGEASESAAETATPAAENPPEGESGG